MSLLNHEIHAYGHEGYLTNEKDSEEDDEKAGKTFQYIKFNSYYKMNFGYM